MMKNTSSRRRSSRHSGSPAQKQQLDPPDIDDVRSRNNRGIDIDPIETSAICRHFARGGDPPARVRCDAREAKIDAQEQEGQPTLIESLADA